MNEPHHFFHSDGIFSSYLKEQILQPVGLPRSRRPLLRMMWLLGPYQAPGTYLLGLCVHTVPHNYHERAISTMQVSDPVQDLPLPSLTIGLHSVHVACILRFPSPFCVLMRVGHYCPCQPRFTLFCRNSLFQLCSHDEGVGYEQGADDSVRDDISSIRFHMLYVLPPSLPSTLD